MLESKIHELYPMPHILVKVFQAVNDVNTDTQTLENLIKHDPSFTLKILSLVNSSYYGRQNVISLREAISLLGFDIIKNLVTNASIHDLFAFGKVKYNFSGYQLWKHSMGVGVCAKVIAEFLEIDKTIDFFTLGVIHDVGMILEYQYFQDEFNTFLDCLQDPHKTLVELEKDIFNVDHGALSRMLCDAWNIHEDLGNIVGCHHAPLLAGEKYRQSACVLSLADTLTMEMDFGFRYPHLAAVDPYVLDHLNQTPKDLESLRVLFKETLRTAQLPLI